MFFCYFLRWSLSTNCADPPQFFPKTSISRFVHRIDHLTAKHWRGSAMSARDPETQHQVQTNTSEGVIETRLVMRTTPRQLWQHPEGVTSAAGSPGSSSKHDTCASKVKNIHRLNARYWTWAQEMFCSFWARLLWRFGYSLQIVFWAGWKGETQREKMLTRHVWYNTAPSPGDCIHVWLGLKAMHPLFVKFSQNWIKASKRFTKMTNISGFSPHAKKKKN